MPECLMDDPDANANDPEAITRRLYRIASIVAGANNKLMAISSSIPVGPPNQPQKDACSQIIQQANICIQLATALKNRQ